MEKRILVVIVLSIAFMVIWNHFVIAPKQAELQARAEAEQARLEAEAAAEVAARPPEAADPAKPAAVPPPAETGAEPIAATDVAAEEATWETVTAEAEEVALVDEALYRVEVTNVGGRIKSWILTSFNGGDGSPLELVAASGHTLGHLPLEIAYGGPENSARINSALWRVEHDAVVDPELLGRYDGTVARTLRMVYADGRGIEAVKEFVFYHDTYRVGFGCRVTNQGTPQEFGLTLGPGFGNPSTEEAKSRYFFFGRALLETAPPGGSSKIERVADQEVSSKGRDESGYLLGFIRKRVPYRKDGDALRIENPVRWIGLEDNYFLFSMVPGALPGPARIHPYIIEVEAEIEAGADEKKTTQPEVHLAVSTTVNPESPHFDLYVGPKEDAALRAGGLDPKQVIDFGFFGVIARPLLWLLNAIYGAVGNYGIAIIILTILIKILFLPLTHKQLSSMKKMQSVQPQMKAIQAKHKKVKGDMKAKQKMNEEVMALYKKEGVNPLGGCFPLLLQLPVLYAFYSFLPAAIELRQAPFFLWVQDLSLKDPYYVTPIVMGLTMFLQQKLTPMASVDPTQRRMFLFMPLIFTVFFISLPSGLVLYWLVNNVLSIFQQMFINRQKDPAAAVPAGKKGKAGKTVAPKPRKKK